MQPLDFNPLRFNQQTLIRAYLELDRNRERKLEIKKTLSLSIINYQLLIINYQLSIINYPLSIINYPLSIINYQLLIIHW
ncbi:hypothetical protein [Dapis sp. BLCC M172]|uniref:hypothetical protein n=1 Tax=Dapis sp. BLCC M172 TaxID=2975281 RepID=UPI003CEDD06A